MQTKLVKGNCNMKYVVPNERDYTASIPRFGNLLPCIYPKYTIGKGTT